MELKIEQGDSPASQVLDTIEVATAQQESAGQSSTISPIKTNPSIERPPQPSHMESPGNQILGGEIMVKLEPGKPPKLSRTSTQKVTARPVQLFDDYPDKTKEATGVFQVIPECSYSSKYLGSTEHAMDCDCAEEWGKHVALQLHYKTWLTSLVRCLDENQLCLWRGFGLHQSRYQNGVFRGLWVRRRLSKPKVPTTTVCQCHCHPDREERLWIAYEFRSTSS